MEGQTDHGPELAGLGLRGLVLAWHLGVPRLHGPEDARLLGLPVRTRQVQGHQQGLVHLERHERAVRFQRPRGDLPEGCHPPQRQRRAQGCAQHVRLLPSSGHLRRPGEARAGGPALRAHAVLLHRLAQVRRDLDRRQLRQVGALADIYRHGRGPHPGGPVVGGSRCWRLLQASRLRDVCAVVSVGRLGLPLLEEPRALGDPTPRALHVRRVDNDHGQGYAAAALQDVATLVHGLPRVPHTGQTGRPTAVLGLPGRRADALRRAGRGEPDHAERRSLGARNLQAALGEHLHHHLLAVHCGLVRLVHRRLLSAGTLRRAGHNADNPGILPRRHRGAFEEPHP
mmetsp:Transcript_158564/g.508703  ORF Transcript_158564/g.508703 Transcript_158564/m.508703 type:complete len:341 (+) Transcript_158564:1688-2710(+)